MKQILTLALFAIGVSTLAMSAVAPEIDAASGGSALALLAGSVLMIRGRQKK